MVRTARTRWLGPMAGLSLVVALAGCASSAPDATPLPPVSTTTPAASDGSPSPSPSADPTDPADPTASTPSGSTTTESQTTATPDPDATLDPAYAVEPPGPRTGRLRTPDILAIGDEAWPDAVIERLEKLEGVDSVLRLSLVEVPVEGTSLRVAVVDPGTYRNYTQVVSADLQRMWERVARGEVATRPELQGKLPLDQHDFVTLGSGPDAPRVHVGAYAPQIPQVDAVVNEKWGEALAAPKGNAVLISTGTTSPQSVRPKVQSILGRDASVQLGDAITEYGLDPDVRQTAVVVGTVAEVVGTYHYTVIGGGRIEPDPAWVAANIATGEVPILGEVTCHRRLFPQLRAALQEVVDAGLADAIHPEEYAGCYYPRFIAGTTRLSNHAYGTALDLNVPGNQRGTAGEIDRRVVAIFDKWGFDWGGNWSWTDPMHFEMRELVDPQVR